MDTLTDPPVHQEQLVSTPWHRNRDSGSTWVILRVTHTVTVMLSTQCSGMCNNMAHHARKGDMLAASLLRVKVEMNNVLAARLVYQIKNEDLCGFNCH